MAPGAPARGGRPACSAKNPPGNEWTRAPGRWIGSLNQKVCAAGDEQVGTAVVVAAAAGEHGGVPSTSTTSNGAGRGHQGRVDGPALGIQAGQARFVHHPATGDDRRRRGDAAAERPAAVDHEVASTIRARPTGKVQPAVTMSRSGQGSGARGVVNECGIVAGVGADHDAPPDEGAASDNSSMISSARERQLRPTPPAAARHPERARHASGSPRGRAGSRRRCRDFRPPARRTLGQQRLDLARMSAAVSLMPAPRRPSAGARPGPRRRTRGRTAGGRASSGRRGRPRAAQRRLVQLAQLAQEAVEVFDAVVEMELVVVADAEEQRRLVLADQP